VSNELVSVVIPAYNRAYCVASTIDSVLGQTHRAVEVIVIDDGSTDDIAEVMARRYGQDPRVRFFRQANAGVPSARNHGFRKAAGAVIAPMDSDDQWLPWKLEVQLACMRHFGVQTICSDMSTVDSAGTVKNSRALHALYHAWHRFPLTELFDRSATLGAIIPGVGPADDRAYAGDVFTAAVVGNLVCTSTLLLTRGCLERIGPYDESLVPAGEDYEFHLRLCRDGPLCLLDATTTMYRYGESDQVTKRTLALALSYVRVLEPALARDRGRIRLSDDEVHRTLADACRWAASELLAAGRGPEAVAYYRRAIALGNRDPQTFLRLALAATPARVRAAALRLYRTVKPLPPQGR
jgi:glycosyltransferase involved in cell wall biosynthesis